MPWRRRSSPAAVRAARSSGCRPSRSAAISLFLLSLLHPLDDRRQFIQGIIRDEYVTLIVVGTAHDESELHARLEEPLRFSEKRRDFLMDFIQRHSPSPGW